MAIINTLVSKYRHINVDIKCNINIDMISLLPTILIHNRVNSVSVTNINSEINSILSEFLNARTKNNVT